MELLEKLFSKKKPDVHIEESPKSSIRCPNNDTGQVRVLLFKECDWRGRKLLFDSATIYKILSEKNDLSTKKTSETPFILEVSNGFTYLYKGPSADASALGEMIFGAVAMSHRGASLKIHIMDDPKRLMCTKVFFVPCRRANAKRASSSAVDTCDNPDGPKTKPVNVPSSSGVALSFSFDRGDSGFCGEHSMHSSMSSTCDFFTLWEGSTSQDDMYMFNSPSGRKLSACSTGSWQRRASRNLITKFDLSSNYLGVPNVSTNESQINSNSSGSSTSESLSSVVASQKRSKLGLALLITVTEENDNTDVIRRYLEHSPYLHALVCRLRLATIAAGAGNAFIAVMYEAARDASKWFSDLLNGPRLQSIWSSMLMTDKRKDTLAEKLISDMCTVLSLGDTKNTNFFFSTLLTQVLTHHLGWVTTVSPYDVIDPQNNIDGSTNKLQHYNTLWAQLNDLCGSIGFPPKAAKTIVSGTNNVTYVNRVLIVLSYFLRCGEVRNCDLVFEKSARKSSVKSVVSVDKCTLKRISTKVDLVGETSESDVQTVKKTGLKRTSTMDFKWKFNSGNDLVNTKLSDVDDLTGKVESSSGNDNVVFVLGDDEKLVGIKNKKPIKGKIVKKTSRAETDNECVSEKCKEESSHAKFCEKLEHSKPLKHSGFKFDFDKYPQIVTNYMKSKNLEILDRHYIGKPGNLKLDNFQFDPMVIPQIQEEKCVACNACQQMDAMLQTPTNASEMEFMNDMPQYATETIVDESPKVKTFVHKHQPNTILVNVTQPDPVVEKNNQISVKRIAEIEMDCSEVKSWRRAGFVETLMGGVIDHYVPDLVLQGVTSKPSSWCPNLKRDLDLSTYLNKTFETPIQAVAIIGDTDAWEVRVMSREGNNVSGMSALVATMLDALPLMWRAKVPAHQCISFMESKLREFCVLSKTLADMLMSTDFCDMDTLTKSLNIDINDVPLLMSVATTHTPQIATRYGISYK